MKKIRLVRWFSLLLILVVLVQCAMATPTEILPASSYYEGRTHFDSDGFKGYIDFAVYDTDGGNEFGAYNAPGEGRYIYAYQVFTDIAGAAIDYFAITGIGGGVDIDNSVDMGSEDDLAGGIEPDSENFNGDHTKPMWEFDDGALFAGEHSWFLLLRSDHGPKIGGYEFVPSNDDDLIVPDLSAPEPATIAMLSIGGILALKRRKKKQ